VVSPDRAVERPVSESSNELIVEILKELRSSLSRLNDDVQELKREFIAMRGHMLAMQQDIANIYGVLARHGVRLDRIERRLGLVEPSA
jgi:predicted  nucleic acid-binding Zn-ribbon protein